MRYVLLGLITIGMMTYAVIDCVRTEDSRIRLGLPHWFWVAIIILLPFAGALTWLIVAAVNRQKYEDGPSARPQRPRGPVAPDDDPDFLFRLERDRRRAQKERGASQARDDTARDSGTRPADTPAPADPEESGDEPGLGEETAPDPDSGQEQAAGPAEEDGDEPLYVPEEFSVPDLLGESDPAGEQPDEPAEPDDGPSAPDHDDDDRGQPGEGSGRRRTGERQSGDDENGRR